MIIPGGNRVAGWVAAVAIVVGAAPFGWNSSRAAGDESARAISPGALPLVDRFPADATSYLYRMGWEDLEGRLKGTTVLEVIKSPAVQRFFEEMKRLGPVNHDPWRTGGSASLSRSRIAPGGPFTWTGSAQAGDPARAKAGPHSQH